MFNTAARGNIIGSTVPPDQFIPVQGDPFNGVAFTPVDGDPFTAAQAYADALPNADQDSMTHWSGQAGAPSQGLRGIAGDPSYSMAARVAAAVPVAISDKIGGLAQSAWGAATLPGDVAQGKIDPMSQQGIARATDLAGLLAAPAVGETANPDTLGIFAGAASRGADQDALAAAQKMAAQGGDRNSIWNATGWFTGADGQWRYEIPDNASALTDRASTNIGEHGSTMGRAAEIVNHPDLMSAYPHIGELPMGVSIAGQTRRPTPSGYYSPEPLAGGEPRIGVNANSWSGPSGPTSISLHELQHAVQDVEGFAPGASPLLDMGARQRNAGEVEARNVQSRMHMTPDHRRVVPPWETQDTPNDQQIILTPVQHNPFSETGAI